MKLPNPKARLLAFGDGNFKYQAAPGEICADAFSDRGSTPLASTKTRIDELCILSETSLHLKQNYHLNRNGLGGSSCIPSTILSFIYLLIRIKNSSNLPNK